MAGPSSWWRGLVAIAWFGLGFSRFSDRIDAFQRVPTNGQGEVTFDEAGGYVIYFEGPGASDGEIPSGQAQLDARRRRRPGAARDYDVGLHLRPQRARGVAVLTVDIEQPGTYLLESESEGEGELAVGAAWPAPSSPASSAASPSAGWAWSPASSCSSSPPSAGGAPGPGTPRGSRPRPVPSRPAPAVRVDAPPPPPPPPPRAAAARLDRHPSLAPAAPVGANHLLTSLHGERLIILSRWRRPPAGAFRPSSPRTE